jgi:hypothetical protein
LDLLFEQAQRKLHIVIVDFDNQHNVTNVAAQSALAAVWLDLP